jgi:hypothetical protein
MDVDQDLMNVHGVRAPSKTIAGSILAPVTDTVGAVLAKSEPTNGGTKARVRTGARSGCRKTSNEKSSPHALQCF